MKTPTRSRWTFFAALAVLLLAAYVRIHGLNAQGLWGDEGWSIWLARGDTVRDLTLTMVADHHGPVYSILLRAWALVACDSVLALRMITVLFSLTSIALLYRLGRELLTPAAGVGAALAFTLMDKQVVLTQEVRDYPMIFLTMIVIALFYARWRRDPGHGHAFGFVAASIIGLYLQYYCYMVNIAILIHALITLRDRRRWRHFVALNALIALAFAPWLPIVVHQFVNTPVNSEVLNIHGMPLNRHTLKYLADESLGKPMALYGLLMLAGLIAPFFRRLPGALDRVRRERRISAALLAGSWLAVPLIITLGLHSRYPLLTDRNISVIMPAIALLVGFSFLVFERYGAVFLVTLVLVNNLTVTSSYYVKPPWREMAADVTPYTLSGEPVLLDVEGEHAAAWYHFSLDLPVDMHEILDLLPAEAEGVDRAVSLYDLRKRYGGDFVPRLQTLIADAPGLWLAYWGDEAKKHDVFDVLDSAGFVRTATLPYSHHGYPIYAYRYDRASTLQNVIARFGDSITLRRVVYPDSIAAGDDVRVLLWWSTDTAPQLDYSVSVFLLDADGVLRAQQDGYPAEGAAPTSAWTPGEFVFDAHTLTGHLAPGTYTVGIKLYTWWDNVILPTADGADYFAAGTVTVKPK
jgi:mannosyltransferase